MERIRKPFQGVWNIVRFNWHFYVIAVFIICVLVLTGFLIGNNCLNPFSVVAFGIFIPTMISLIVSWYVYDYSDLYSLNWLNEFDLNPAVMININAGFDEFSLMLQHKFKDARLEVFDFYAALPQKEISITRAQKVYPACVSTKQISLIEIPIEVKVVDVVCLFLAAHEIRNEKDRVCFFKELNRSLNADGKIVVIEHLRNGYNFLAYTIGFLHFLPLGKWLKTFSDAGLKVISETKITPFINLFILQKDGNSF